MYKIILGFIASVVFIGCSNFSINASMCDRSEERRVGKE